jgi:hypothetical protein
MALTEIQKLNVKDTIKSCLREKLIKYKPENKKMPFHYRLLGEDRMVLYSFVHSLNTTFGDSIFVPVAVALSKTRFQKVEAHFDAGNMISKDCHQVIQKIMSKLITGKSPNKVLELTEIREAASKGELVKIKTVKVDLLLENNSGEKFLFDLKRANPSISTYKGCKRTLLEWAAIALTSDNCSKVNTLIAIPYNPYAPKPYERWTSKGMLDFKYELKIAEEFWDFLGGKGAYIDLLSCFEQAGIELRPEIDEYFERFRKK